MDFFFPLIGREKPVVEENVAVNIKVSEKFAQLYNECRLNNTQTALADISELICRTLFCCVIDSMGLLMTGDSSLYVFAQKYTDVTTRIKNAIHEPTYLMNDVEVVLTVRCYNLDVPYLEASIHSFFSNVNVFFEVRDDEGIMHYPKEWFTVPLNIIEEAIPLIVDKKIDSYRYDKNLQMIIQKGTSE